MLKTLAVLEIFNFLLCFFGQCRETPYKKAKINFKINDATD